MVGLAFSSSLPPVQAQRGARETTPLIDLTDPQLVTSEQQDLDTAIALSIEEAKASEGIAVEGQIVQQDKPSGPSNPSMTLGEALIAAAKQASASLAHQVHPPSLPPNPETSPLQPTSNVERDSPGLPDSEDDMERAIRLSLQRSHPTSCCMPCTKSICDLNGTLTA